MAGLKMSDEHFLRSSKNLWLLISGSSIRSKELVGTELQANLLKCIKGLSFYKNASPESAKALKDKKLDLKLEKFIIQLSRFMDLDEMLCYDLFCDFLLYDYKGSESVPQSITTDERSMQNVLLSIWDYYRCERLYLLLCVKEIFGHVNDESHPYMDLFKDFVSLLDEGDVLYKSFLEQWRLLQSSAFAGSKMQASIIVDVQSQTWTLFNLREQCELLQILLLYFKNKSLTGSEFYSLLTTFKDHGFGHKQSLDSSDETISDSISRLECLIIIECLKLNSMTADSASDDYFMKSTDKSFKDSDALILRLGYQKEHGPLMLAWTAVRSRVLRDKDAASTRRLGKAALTSGAFVFLQRILESPLFQGSGAVANCANSVVYDLLTALLVEFDESSLGSSLVLSQICYRLFKNRQLAAHFWKRGLTNGIGLMVTSLMNRFPYSFGPLAYVLAGLSAASAFSASKVLRTFQELPSCTLARDPQVAVQDMYDSEEDGYTLCLLENYSPFAPDDRIRLPTGTRGCSFGERLGASADEPRAPLIQWKCDLNGWALCLVVVDRLLGESSAGLCQPTSDLISQVTSVAELVKHLLVSDPNLITELLPLVDKLFAVIRRLRNLPQPPLELMALMLDAASALSGRDDFKQTWCKVVQTGILPVQSSSPITADAFDWGQSDSVHGSIKKLITAHECVSGNYRLTLAFLGLISACVEDMAGEGDHHYVASVGFIVGEVIPSYGKWWFRQVEHREQVGQRCLDVVIRVLGVPHSDGDVSKNWESLRKTIVHSLLFQEAGQSLLHLVCIGEEAIHRALEHQSSWVSGRGLELIRLVKLSLSVLNRLLTFCSSDVERNSPMVVALSSKPQIIRIVAYYVYHRFDVRLPTLAMLLMRRLARELSMSLIVCLGPNAVPFCKRLVLRLEARTEDSQLKVAILKFLAACAESQPGMTEALVGGSTHSSDSKAENLCLLLAVRMLEQYTENRASAAKELRVAALSFLYALWFGRHVLALDALRTERSRLWPALLDAFNDVDLESANYMAPAYTLGIFAEEFLLLTDPKVLADFSEVLEKRLIEKSVLSAWADKIFGTLKPSNNGSTTGKPAKDVIAFLKALRNFLMIGIKVGHLSIPVVQKNSILDGCLQCLMANASGPQDRTSMTVLSETLLHLMHSWQEECQAHLSHWPEQSIRLMKTIVTSSEGMPTTVACDILAICTCIVQATNSSKSKSDETVFCSWMSVAGEVLTRCLLEAESTIRDNQLVPSKLQLVVLCSSFVQRLLGSCDGRPDGWLTEFQKRSLPHDLLGFAVTCLTLHVALEPCRSVVELLAVLARLDRVCELLVASGLLQAMCLTMLHMPPLYESVSDGVRIAKPQVGWNDVYEAGLRLITAVLHSQRHFVVTSVLDFTVIHLEKFQLLPLILYARLDERLLRSSTVILRLVYELSSFRSAWQLHSDTNSRGLLDFTFTIFYAAVAYLIRPQIILQSIGETPKVTTDEEDGVRLRRISSAELVEKPDSRLHSITARLVEVLSICVAIMCQFTPDLCELLSDQSCDLSRWIPLLEPSFSTPSLEQIKYIDFGTIISCAVLCTRMLNTNERGASPVKSSPSETAVAHNKQLVSCLLERSLYLIVSQAGLILSREQATSWDRQLFKRELAAELSSCVQSRYVRRSTLTVSPVASAGEPCVPLSPASQTSRSKSALENRPFLNLIISIADSSFK